MKIGIMGGTFDPIHNGHLMLAETAFTQFSLDEIWFMPNGRPPHKQWKSIASDVEDRIVMTRLAIEGRARFKLELYEARRETVSYSYETLRHLTELYPDDSFYFIVGADSLFAIETWVHPEKIFPLCTILAACRDEIDTTEEMDEQISYLCEKYHADIELLASPLMPVSSHELREAIASGKSITGYVPKKVEEYILEEGLYGSKDRKNEP